MSYSDFPIFLKIAIKEHCVKCIRVNKTFYYCIMDLAQAFPEYITEDFKNRDDIKHMTYLNPMGIQSFYYMMTSKQLFTLLPLLEWSKLTMKSIIAYRKDRY